MSADTLSSSESSKAWEAYKILDNTGANSKYFNLVELSSKGNAVYGYIRENIASLIIPVFSESPRFFKNVISEWNKCFLQSKDKRLFFPEEFCYSIGITETRSPETLCQSLLVGKYCVGPVTNWSEVGILIKSGKDIKLTPAVFAAQVASELSLEVHPIKFSVLGVLK